MDYSGETSTLLRPKCLREQLAASDQHAKHRPKISQDGWNPAPWTINLYKYFDFTEWCHGARSSAPAIYWLVYVCFQVCAICIWNTAVTINLLSVSSLYHLGPGQPCRICLHRAFETCELRLVHLQWHKGQGLRKAIFTKRNCCSSVQAAKSPSPLAPGVFPGTFAAEDRGIIPQWTQREFQVTRGGAMVETPWEQGTAVHQNTGNPLVSWFLLFQFNISMC